MDENQINHGFIKVWAESMNVIGPDLNLIHGYSLAHPWI
jgi:hypothetical protein